MTAATFDLDAVANALIIAGNTFLTEKGKQAQVLDSFPPADAEMPYAVQYMLGLGTRYAAPLAAETLWPQQLQITAVGLIPSQARLLAQSLDEFLVGVDLDAHYLHEIDLSALGLAVSRRESNRDGHGDMSGILHTWVTTYTLDLQLL